MPAHSEKKAQYLSIDGSERGSYQYNNLLTFHYRCTLQSKMVMGRMAVPGRMQILAFSYWVTARKTECGGIVAWLK
jgi:hypothetical protein